MKNLAGLVIGQHLVFDGRAYRLEITAAETKTGRPYIAAVPHELTTYIDRWLQVYRPQLIASADRRARSVDAHLWLSRSGEPMTSHAIHAQITLRTRQAFGNAVWPHLFRDCAVTELVDCAPEEIRIAPDLLGHAGLQTTRKHYIQAQGMTAHRLMQEVIAARRRAAARGERRVPEVAPTAGPIPAGLARHSVDLPIRLHEPCLNSTGTAAMDVSTWLAGPVPGRLRGGVPRQPH